MASYTEGNQLISFPESWQILRLDQHRYYIRISGKGLKAVDFIAIDEQFGLVLIEIKDYSTAALPKEPDLKQIAEQKRTDSIKVIQIIYQALYRQWFFRWIFLRFGWHRLCPEEWKIWAKAKECIDSGKHLFLMDISHD